MYPVVPWAHSFPAFGQAIFDRASSAGIIFASPRIDVSNDVLAKLGYSK